MAPISFVTGNPGKFKEAQAVLADYCDLVQFDIDLIEIQGTIQEIILDKAKRAYRHLNKPLIVEDVSVHFEALGGFPGPYIKDFLRKLNPKDLYQVMHSIGNTKMSAVSTIGYITTPYEIHVFQGSVEGNVVLPKEDFFFSKLSWNSIFKPTGYNQTFGQLPIEEQAKISHRRNSLVKFVDFLNGGQLT